MEIGMQNIQEGKPILDKKPIALDSFKEEEIHITIVIGRELHRKIMNRKLDEKRTMNKILLEVIEKEFK